MSPLRSRAKDVIIAFTSALFGIALLWLSLSGLVPSMRAIAHRAPLVAFLPSDTMGVCFAFSCFALAVMMVGPAASSTLGGKRKHESAGKAVRWAGRWLTLAVLGVLLGLIMSPISQIAMATVMVRKQYALCPAPKIWERHPPFRWIRAGGRCP